MMDSFSQNRSTSPTPTQTQPSPTSTATSTPTSNTLIAFDGSGSTSGVHQYHQLTQKIASEHPKSQVLFWDDWHWLISHKELKRINDEREGRGGTSPNEIAKGLRELNFHGHLIIISDGQVSQCDVDRCDELLRGWALERVTCHLIGPSHSINMSISCPFTRHCPHEVITYKAEKNYVADAEAKVSTEDFSILAKIDTVSNLEELEANWAAIERVVIARTMGSSGDPTLRDSLLAMKKRIVSQTSRLRGDSAKAVSAMERAASSGDVKEALAHASSLVEEYYVQHGDDDFSEKIRRLVSMCEGALRGRFDLSGIDAAIQGDRVRRAHAATEVAAADVGLTDDRSMGNRFVCPISLDEENDMVLLISEGDPKQRIEDEPVLGGLDKAITNELFDCPLNLFRHPEVVEKLVERIDHPMGLRAYRGARSSGHPISVSPFTRKRLVGALCLGSNEEHCRATTWTLAHTLLGGKLVGNSDLWFACVWLLVERGRIPYLKDILPQLRAHMQYRLKRHKTFMSLSGLAQYPTFSIPLGLAVWFVLSSAAMEPSLSAERDVLRLHLPHLEELQQMNELNGWRVPDGLSEHLLRLRVGMHMLSWMKKDRHELGLLIQGLWQRYAPIYVENVSAEVRSKETRVPAWVPLDGDAPAEQTAMLLQSLPSMYRELPISDLACLYEEVSRAKSGKEFSIGYGSKWAGASGFVAPKGKVEWGYGTSTTVAKCSTPICALTCRPFSVGGSDGTMSWREQAEAAYGLAVKEMMSCGSRYLQFVEKHGKYPNRDEYLVFLFNRYIEHGQHHTLPAPIEQFYDELVSDYQSAFPSGFLAVPDFLHRVHRSKQISTRRRIERGKLVLKPIDAAACIKPAAKIQVEKTVEDSIESLKSLICSLPRVRGQKMKHPFRKERHRKGLFRQVRLLQGDAFRVHRKGQPVQVVKNYQRLIIRQKKPRVVRRTFRRAPDAPLSASDAAIDKMLQTKDIRSARARPKRKTPRQSHVRHNVVIGKARKNSPNHVVNKKGLRKSSPSSGKMGPCVPIPRPSPPRHSLRELTSSDDDIDDCEVGLETDGFVGIMDTIMDSKQIRNAKARRKQEKQMLVNRKSIKSWKGTSASQSNL